MLKRPSSRRRSAHEEITLNLVPMMDGLVTLIAFLLFTMSFISVVALDSLVPVASKPSEMNAAEVKPLQLTLTIEKAKMILWSPFDRIPAREFLVLPTGEFDVAALHDALLVVKNQFPKDTQIIFVPDGGIAYDSLIALMDASRTVEKTDPPLYTKNEVTGTDEPVVFLFPDVVFGNLIAENEGN